MSGICNSFKEESDLNRKIEKLAVLGTGFIGLQILCKALSAGYVVTTFDPDAGAVGRAVKELKELFLLQGLVDHEKAIDTDVEKIQVAPTLEEAVSDADIIIEAVSEKLDLKKQIFSRIDASAPPGAIIASNSSSIPVTRFEDAIADKTRVLNIHFDAPLLDRPLVDVMPGRQTTVETIETAMAWVRSIGCNPIQVKKPIMGYLGNRLWRAVKRESLVLWAEGFGDFREIDRSWMLQIGVDIGPFAMMDVVGLDVVYDIELAYYHHSKDERDKPPIALKDKIDRGELGLKSGKGFYDWSDPDFAKPGFLKGEY